MFIDLERLFEPVKDGWNPFGTWNLHDESSYGIRTCQISWRCWFRRYKITKCNRPLEKVCQWPIRSMAEHRNQKADYWNSRAGIIWCSIYLLSIGYQVSKIHSNIDDLTLMTILKWWTIIDSDLVFGDMCMNHAAWYSSSL